MTQRALTIASLTALLASLFFATAEEKPVSAAGYRIEAETYVISGRTREAAVRARLGSAEGKTFASRERLEAFAQERAQRLENLRTFKKSSVTVDYPSDAPEDPSLPVPVTLRTTIEDGSEFVPIPYLFYNSNEGFMAGTITNAPNLNGTLENLAVVALYTAPPDDDDRLQWTDPNFVALATLSGVRVDGFELGFVAGVMRMNKDIEDRGIVKTKYNEVLVTGSTTLSWNITPSLKNATKLRFGISPSSDIVEVRDPDYLSYGPVKYLIEGEDSLTRDAVNWKGNFRAGSKATVRAGYAIASPTDASATRKLSGGAEFAGFKIVGSWLNPSFRVGVKGNTGDPDLEAGLPIRGIRNSGVKGNAVAYANGTLQARILRVGHTEVHLAPIMDAIAAYAPDDPDYEWDWGLTAGGELLFFFDAMKSLPIKFGFAYDLRPDSRVHEKRYEIDFSFSMTY
jgi:hypothetical protein